MNIKETVLTILRGRGRDGLRCGGLPGGCTVTSILGILSNLSSLSGVGSLSSSRRNGILVDFVLPPLV
jgi:hypothetical protein